MLALPVTDANERNQDNNNRKRNLPGSKEGVRNTTLLERKENEN